MFAFIYFYFLYGWDLLFRVKVLSPWFSFRVYFYGRGLLAAASPSAPTFIATVGDGDLDGWNVCKTYLGSNFGDNFEGD